MTPAIIEASDVACASAAVDLASPFRGDIDPNQQVALIAQLFADHRAKAVLAPMSWAEAVGLMTTFKPNLVMRADDPIGMAKEVEAHVALLSKDAARYRYLRAKRSRDAFVVDGWIHVCREWPFMDEILTGDACDAIVDLARQPTP